MTQWPLFDDAALGNAQAKLRGASPDLMSFDKRRRSYETDEAYARRLEMIAQAFQTDYRTSKWVPIVTWADICPQDPEIDCRETRTKSATTAAFISQYTILSLRTGLFQHDWQNRTPRSASSRNLLCQDRRRATLSVQGTARKMRHLPR